MQMQQTNNETSLYVFANFSELQMFNVICRLVVDTFMTFLVQNLTCHFLLGALEVVQIFLIYTLINFQFLQFKAQHYFREDSYHHHGSTPKTNVTNTLQVLQNHCISSIHVVLGA